jgi:hypothetical protein
MIKPPISYRINDGSPWQLTTPYAYVLAANGIFKVAQNQVIVASIPIALVPRLIPGLKPMKVFARLRAGKVDGGMLLKILEDATESEAEAMYNFGISNGSIKATKPQQKGSNRRVSYSPDYHSMIEIHSHPRMGAYFSEIDNVDEQGFKFYGVLGHIFTEPEFVLRIGIYGDWMAIPPTDLFTHVGFTMKIEVKKLPPTLFTHVGHIKELYHENRDQETL